MLLLFMRSSDGPNDCRQEEPDEDGAQEQGRWKRRRSGRWKPLSSCFPNSGPLNLSSTSRVE